MTQWAMMWSGERITPPSKKHDTMQHRMQTLDILHTCGTRDVVLVEVEQDEKGRWVRAADVAVVAVTWDEHTGYIPVWAHWMGNGWG